MNLRQFFTLLRQQRLFSGIYILCTALSTALTMTLFLVVYIMVGPVYPELERSRMAVVDNIRYEDDRGSINEGGTNAVLGDSLRRLPEVECLTAIEMGEVKTVTCSDGENLTVLPQYVDEDYWRVFSFRFVHGRAFSHEEVDGHSPVCVISKGLAQRVFGQTDVVGRTLDMGGANVYESNAPDEQRRIVGVVEDVSAATPFTCTQAWMPLDRSDYYIDSQRPFMGGSTLVMLLRRGKTIEQLREHAAQFEERVNQEAAGAGSALHLNLMGQPNIMWQAYFSDYGSGNWLPNIRKILGLLLAFLFIPAMNMSSMVASRVNARIGEMGIRRAYGASRATLLWQVLQENFLLTLIGSLAGLAISWLIMTLCADWLPFIFNQYGRWMASKAMEPVRIHADMLFSGWVMAAVLAAALVLNLISALVPTMWTLHKAVTEEINHKR